MARLFIIKQKEKKKLKLEKKHFIGIGVFVLLIFVSIFFLILNTSIDSDYEEDYTGTHYDIVNGEKEEESEDTANGEEEEGMDLFPSFGNIFWIWVICMAWITYYVFKRRLIW